MGKGGIWGREEGKEGRGFRWLMGEKRLGICWFWEV